MSKPDPTRPFEPVEGIPEWARKRLMDRYGKAPEPEKYDPDKDPEPTLDTEEGRAQYKKKMLAKLRDTHAALITPTVLAVGNIVAWKPNLANLMGRMKYEEFGIVTEVFTPVEPEKEDFTSVHFREKIDVRVLAFPHPDYAVEFHCDSRRLQKIED